MWCDRTRCRTVPGLALPEFRAAREAAREAKGHRNSWYNQARGRGDGSRGGELTVAENRPGAVPNPGSTHASQGREQC